MFRFQKTLGVILSGAILVIILIYGGYKLLPIIRGPEIEVSNVNSGDLLSGTTITLRGSTKRVTKLYINGSKVNLSKEGSFETDLAIWEGSTILLLEGYDRFGRKVSITKIIGTQ
jgi:hypothetical protein